MMLRNEEAARKSVVYGRRVLALVASAVSWSLVICGGHGDNLQAAMGMSLAKNRAGMSLEAESQVNNKEAVARAESSVESSSSSLAAIGAAASRLDKQNAQHASLHLQQQLQAATGVEWSTDPDNIKIHDGSSNKKGPMGYVSVQTPGGTRGFVCPRAVCPANTAADACKKSRVEAKTNLQHFVVDICMKKGYITGVALPNTKHDNVRPDDLWGSDLDDTITSALIAFPCWGSNFGKCSTPPGGPKCGRSEALKIACSVHVNCDPNLPNSDCWSNTTLESAKESTVGVSSGDFVLNSQLYSKQVAAFDNAFEREVELFAKSYGQDVKELHRQVDENVAAIREHMADIARMNNTVQTHRNEDLYGKLNAEYQANTEALTKFTTNWTKANETFYRDLQKQLDEAKAERDKLEQAIITKTGKLKTDFQNFTSQHTGVAAEIRKMLDEVKDRVKESLKTKSSGNEDKITKQIEEHLKYLDALRNSWNKTVGDYGTASEQARTAIQEQINTEKQKLKGLTDSNKAMSNANKIKAEGNQANITAAQKQADDNEANIKTLQSGLTGIEKDLNNTLKTLEKQREDNKAIIEKQKADIDQEIADRKKALDALVSERNAAAAGLEGNRALNDENQTAAENSLTTEVSKAEIARTALQQRISDLSIRINKLEDWAHIESCGPA